MLLGFFNPCSEIYTKESWDSKEVVNVVDVRETTDELENLLPAANYVHELTPGQDTVDSEWLSDFGGLESKHSLAMATPPIEFDVMVPDHVMPGERFMVQGPNGQIPLVAPLDRIAILAGPMKVSLAPRPDFRVEIPPGHQAGNRIVHTREDGVQIAVDVPATMAPGEVLAVTPPVLMVSVPYGTRGGETVAFRAVGPKFASCKGGSSFCTARVPEGLRPGQYFAARLPRPPKKGGGGVAAAPREVEELHGEERVLREHDDLQGVHEADDFRYNI